MVSVLTIEPKALGINARRGVGFLRVIKIAEPLLSDGK
jgi:hypothetical protein